MEKKSEKEFPGMMSPHAPASGSSTHKILPRAQARSDALLLWLVGPNNAALPQSLLDLRRTIESVPAGLSKNYH